MSYDSVIKNGTVVTADDSYMADVAINGTQIVAIGRDLQGKREIDAEGKLVIPGAVDIHVHMQMPFPGNVTTVDTFLTGSQAAACGGTTTIIDFVHAEPDETLLEALTLRRAEADPQVITDYALHMVITPQHMAELDQLEAIAAAGCRTFKLYMAYGFSLDDDQLLRAFQAIRRVNGFPVVHSENWDVISTLVAQSLAAGNTTPHWHPRTRPAGLEGEATGRTIDLATFVGLPVHIFHVSCDSAVDRIRSARRQGLPVTGETCPQYLFKTWDAYDAPGLAGTLPVCAPPIREQAEQDALWRALADDGLQVVASDHCPFSTTQKARGLDDFSQIPGGVHSVEMRLSGVYSKGVAGGLISVQQWVDMCATTPARLMGLPQKGRIAVGADADIVIFDPKATWTVSTETLHEASDWTLYEGEVLTGRSQHVFSRGEQIVVDGEPVAQAGRGEFLVTKPVY